MNDNKTKKEILAQYKEREIIGGIYVIKNTLNNKIFLDSSADLKGSQNRFDFAQKTGVCVHIKLQNDWNKQGGGQFIFEILEELKKNETQTADEFKAYINILKDFYINISKPRINHVPQIIEIYIPFVPVRARLDRDKADSNFCIGGTRAPFDLFHSADHRYGIGRHKKRICL